MSEEEVTTEDVFGALLADADFRDEYMRVLQESAWERGHNAGFGDGYQTLRGGLWTSTPNPFTVEDADDE